MATLVKWAIMKLHYSVRFAWGAHLSVESKKE